jgi:hypothetical protein
MPPFTAEQQHLEQEIARLKERLAQLTSDVPVSSTPKSDMEWSMVDKPEEIKSELFPSWDAHQAYVDLVHAKLKNVYSENQWNIYLIREAMDLPDFNQFTNKSIDLFKVDFLITPRSDQSIWVLIQCSRTRSGLFLHDDHTLCTQIQKVLKSPNRTLSKVVVGRWYPDRIRPINIDGVKIVDVYCPITVSTAPVPFTNDEFQLYLNDIVAPALQQQYPNCVMYFNASSVSRLIEVAGLIRYITCEDIDILLEDRFRGDEYHLIQYHLIQCSRNKVGKPSFKGDLPHQVDRTCSQVKINVQRWYPDVAPDAVMVSGVTDVYAPFVVNDVPSPSPSKPLVSSENQPHVDTIMKQLKTEQKKCVIVQCQPRSIRESLFVDLGYQWAKSMSDYHIDVINPCETYPVSPDCEGLSSKWVQTWITNSDTLLQWGNRISTNSTPTLVIVRDYLSDERAYRTEWWRAYLNLLEGVNRQVVVLTTTDPPLNVLVPQDKCAIIALQPSSHYVGLRQMYIEGRMRSGTTLHELSNVRTLFQEQIVDPSSNVRSDKMIHFIRCRGEATAYLTILNLERVAHELSIRIEVLELDKLDIKDMYEWTRNVIPAHVHTFVIMTKELPAGQFIHLERVGFLHDIVSPVSSYCNSLVGRACMLSGPKDLKHVLYTDVTEVLDYLTSMNRL